MNICEKAVFREAVLFTLTSLSQAMRRSTCLLMMLSDRRACLDAHANSSVFGGRRNDEQLTIELGKGDTASKYVIQAEFRRYRRLCGVLPRRRGSKPVVAQEFHNKFHAL